MQATLALALCCGWMAAPPVSAQEAVEEKPPGPKANPADVSTLDGILKALYGTISGEASEKRDWDRLRSLFAEEARLIPVNQPREGGVPRITSMSVDQFIERVKPYSEREGFFEIEIARKVDTFGALSHVFSTYESRRAPGEKPFTRGINSIQLFHDGVRYWIVTIYWDHERTGLTLPEAYLPKP
jgi:hypothetical protein